MEEQGDHKALAEALDRWSRTAERLLQAGSTTTQTVRVEGMGSMWNGIAIGIALGATILGVGWISTKLQAQDIAVNQAEAYQKAVYALAPRFAAEIDAELQKQESRRVNANPGHHGSRAAPDDPAAEPAASAASPERKVK